MPGSFGPPRRHEWTEQAFLVSLIHHILLSPDVLTRGTGRRKARGGIKRLLRWFRDDISSRERVSGPRAFTAAKPSIHPH
jgi:hypothetical protein